MPDTSTIFNKTTPTCSNAYLIDEYFCLANSLGIINSNFTSLSSAIASIENAGSYFNNIYTIFAQNSSHWLQASTNVKSYSAVWNNDYKTVNSLSATWANEFAIYYNKMYEFQDWVQTSAFYITNDILNWANFNFPASNFADHQVISIYVNTYEKYEFDLTAFQAYYFHDCHVTGNSEYPASGTLNGCTFPNVDPNSPQAGLGGCLPGGPANCNHHGGGTYEGSCDNYLLHCSKSTPAVSLPYTCTPESGAKTLILPSNGTHYSQFEIDQYMARATKIVYYKPQGLTTWSLLSA
jgi:hypothetical protein